MDVEFAAEEGPFVGCPGDADRFEAVIEEIYADTFVPGVKPKLYYYKKSYDPVAVKGAHADQLKIKATSSALTDPVFILFAHRIGTPVRLPEARRRDMRAWLDNHGWRSVAMLGDPEFADMEAPPANAIPMSGTMFELFDALRTEEATDLRVFDLRELTPPPPKDDDQLQLQAQWCDQLLSDLKKRSYVFAPETEAVFRRDVRSVLRRAFNLRELNPLTDPLPSLNALSEESPLLFGRSALIGSLTTRILGERADGADASDWTLVTGVSGSGKSSLMRAGLLQYWFRKRPMGPARFRGATVLLVEPQQLQLEDDEDPLHALAACLFGAPERVRDRVIGPLTRPLVPRSDSRVPTPPSITGKREADLAAALDWWESILPEVSGPLILVLDQAEQIDALARRRAREAARADIEATELPPEWQRFTTLLGALSGQLDTSGLSSALAARVATFFPRMRLVLTLHRMSALDLWPLNAECRLSPVNVPPLRDAPDIQRIIEGTCAAYGLRIDSVLLAQMIDEATSLAEAQQEVRPPDGNANAAAVTHGAASVLPQLVVALQRMLTEWRGRHQDQAHLPPDAMILDPSYESVSSIAGSIEAIGEQAWAVWQERLAHSSGLSLRSYFARQRLEEEQARRFSHLMAQLVDATSPDRQDLTHLRRESQTAQQRFELIEALRKHYLLTGVSELHLRLPHRSILDHWSRARSWLIEAEARLKAKGRANSYRTLGVGPDQWSDEDVLVFADLVLDWIGNAEGEGAALKAELETGLVARFDPATVDIRSVAALPRLPFDALAAGQRSLAYPLWNKLLASEILPSKAIILATALAEGGETSLLDELLSGLQMDAATVVNSADTETGLFPLLQASWKGHSAVAGLLLKAGARVDQVHKRSGAFPLLVAAQEGHDGFVGLLLDAGAHVDRSHKSLGTFPLLLAAQNEHEGVVDLLLAAGAVADQVNKIEGTFPLLLAAQDGHDGVVDLLLKAGARADQVHEGSGTFPLLLAAQEGNDGVVALLLMAGARADQINKKDGIFPLVKAAENGCAGVVGLLLEAGAQVDRAHESTGVFPLLLAAQNGCDVVVRLLLEARAQVGRVHKSSGVFPLLQAAQNGYDGIVRLLLKAGARVDQVNKVSGTFPLLAAAGRGQDGVVDLLVEAGAPVNQFNNTDGTFPLLAAALRGHDRVVSLLLGAGAPVNQFNKTDGSFPLLVAALRGHDRVVSLLLGAGAPVNQFNKTDGAFPLLLAAQYCHDRVVDQLLAEGAQVDRVHKTDGDFPLLVAAFLGHDRIVGQLLEAGAPVDQVNKIDGTFPLLLAAQNGHDVVLGLLLAAGAKTHRKHSKTGATALTHAVNRKNATAVQTLLAYGASIEDLPDDLRLVASQLVAEGGYKEITPHRSDAEPTHSGEAGPARITLSIPGTWSNARMTPALQKQIATILWQTGIPPQESRIISTQYLVDEFGEDFELRTMIFTLEQEGGGLVLEALWLDAPQELGPVILYPGVDLDGVLVGLQEHGVRLDMRTSREAFAALVASISLPPSVPIKGEGDLPLATSATELMIAYPQQYWKQWLSYIGPVGPVVDLTTIEGDALMRRTVVVPDDGIGARVLDGGTTLVTSKDWALSRYPQNPDGSYLPYRVVGVLQQ